MEELRKQITHALLHETLTLTLTLTLTRPLTLTLTLTRHALLHERGDIEANTVSAELMDEMLRTVDPGRSDEEVLALLAEGLGCKRLEANARIRKKDKAQVRMEPFPI